MVVGEGGVKTAENKTFAPVGKHHLNVVFAIYAILFEMIYLPMLEEKVKLIICRKQYIDRKE